MYMLIKYEGVVNVFNENIHKKKTFLLLFTSF